MTFKQLDIKISRLFKNLANKTKMTEIGKVAKEIVVERTNRGFGVNTPEGKKERLKGLKPSYKKQRRRLKKQGKLASSTTPTKSNLTKTRQMLNSVDSKGETGKATVFLNNQNANKKAEYQAGEGRKFMNLSSSEVKKITKIIEEQIIKDITKNGL